MKTVVRFHHLTVGANKLVGGLAVTPVQDGWHGCGRGRVRVHSSGLEWACSWPCLRDGLSLGLFSL